MPWRITNGRAKATWNSSRRQKPTGWAKTRREVLKTSPTCSWPGCPERSTDVHHRLPQHLGGDEAPSNLIALCSRHHAALSARQGRAAQLRQRGSQGQRAT